MHAFRRIPGFVQSALLVGLMVFAPPAATGAEPGEATISTVAGTGEAGYSGDGGPAAAARLNQPFGVVVGPDRALYICDTGNHCIRRVDPGTGVIRTVAGIGGEPGYSGDGGPALKARLFEPYEIRFDSGGSMFFVEMRNHLVRRVDSESGLISTVAGDGDAGFLGDRGPARGARMSRPHSIQFHSPTALFVCDIGNHRIRRIDLSTGLIDTFAGTGERGTIAPGAACRTAALNGPRAIDFDSNGDLWLALREGNAVYRIDMTTETLHHAAGTGEKGFSGNGGPAAAARLSGPKGVSVGGPRGWVYLADTESHTVRALDPDTGLIHLIAGTGEPGDGPEGDPLGCRMDRLHGVYVDSAGRVFIGDTNNHRVRVIQ